MTGRRPGALWAVTRLLSFDRRGAVPASAAGLSALVVTVLVLVGVNVPIVVSLQLQREAARAPVVDHTAPGDPTRPAAVETELRVGVAVIRRYVVAPLLEDLGAPPGLARLPQPGEIAVSPALLALAGEDRRVARLLETDTEPGLIGSAGLTKPDELVIWTGVDRAQLEPEQTALLGFGERLLLPDVLHRTYWPLYGAVVMLLLGVPLLMLTQVAVRASEAARRQRAAALRLLGVPVSLARTVNCLEIVLPALVGTALGGAVFAVAASSERLAAHVFPEDLLTSGPVWWAALCSAPAVMAVAAIATTRGAGVTSAGLRPRFLPDPPPPRPALALSTVVVWGALTVASLTTGSVTVGAAWWASSTIAAGAVLLTGSRTVVVRLSTLLAERTARPTLLAAFRRIETHARAPLTGGLLLGVVTAATVTFGPLVGSLLGQQHIASDYLRQRERTATAISFLETAHPLDPAEVTAAVALVGVREVPREGGGTERVAVASCSEMRALLSSPRLPCDHAVWRLGVEWEATFEREDAQLVLVDTGPHGALVRLPTVEAVVDSGRQADELVDWIVLSPAVVAGMATPPPLAGHLVTTASDAAGIESLRLDAARLAPGANLYVPYDPGIVGAGRWRAVATFGMILLAASLVLCLLAAALVLMPLTLARHQVQRAWTMIGAPDRFLFGSQWLYCWIPTAFPVVLGASFGLVASAQARQIGLIAPDTSLLGGAGVALLVLVGVGVACAVAALAPAAPNSRTGD